MNTEQIIEQLKQLSEEIGAKVVGSDFYTAKDQWKRLTIDYNFGERK